MNFIPRSSWGANPLAPQGGDVRLSSRTEFFAHYSLGEELGREDTAAWVREIQRFHMGPQRGWADIGYNFLIDKFGNVFEGRGWLKIGAHCPNHNTSGIGVCFLGDDDAEVQDISDAARRAFVELKAQADQKTGKNLRVMGHRDGKATKCPGDEVYDWLQAGMPLGSIPPPVPPPAAPPAPAPAPTPAPVAPHYPLGRCGAHGLLSVFGPKTGPDHYVSGYYSHTADLQRWQQQMAHRGWRIGVDGKYGPNTAEIARKFQAEKGLGVDGLIGPQTWAAAWLAPMR